MACALDVAVESCVVERWRVSMPAARRSDRLRRLKITDGFLVRQTRGTVTRVLSVTSLLPPLPDAVEHQLTYSDFDLRSDEITR